MGFERFEFWRPWASPAFLSPAALDYALLALYTLATAALLARSRRDFRRLWWRRLLVFLGLLVVPLLIDSLLVVTLAGPGLLPPGLPVQPARPYASLLRALLILSVGAWLGAGPAMVLGLVSGLWHAAMLNGGVADGFYFAFFGYVGGFLLRQDYHGRFPLILRQPVAAGGLAVLLSSPFLLFSVFARAAGSGLTGFDYAMQLTEAHLISAMVETAAAVLVLQILFLFPGFRPVRATHQFPPYARTLNRRLLFLFVPLILLTTLLSLYAVTGTTLSVATAEVVAEMARNGDNAAEHITYFIAIGEGQLDRFTDDEVLWSRDPAAMSARLQGDVESSAFFNQLLFFDPQGNLLAAYPPEVAGDPKLTGQEQKMLTNAAVDWARQRPALNALSDGEIVFSFISPVEHRETGEHLGVLLARARLDRNPMMKQVLASLQWMGSRGEGFVVENRGGGVWKVVVHSDPHLLLTDWYREVLPRSVYEVEQGEAYESLHPRDNSRQLVYFLPVAGYDAWAVVIRLPYEVVLERAAQIAIPLFIFQVLTGGGLVVIIPFVTGWLTRPLQQLAAAAGRIAEGNLAQPIQIPGADEVARVGDAFEGMRVRLKGRMGDLSLLLQVSQAVSATLELPMGMPFVLEGALKATQARVARIVLLSVDGYPQMVMSRGEPREGLGALDRALSAVAKDAEAPLIVENLARARTLVEGNVGGDIKALIAFPIRTKDRVPAVMWVGYGEARQFDAAEVDLLSTLAGQTAVLVENARLFQAAEGGRRRLAAILASTSDAVLVTDHDDCLLLVNPAAERAFGIQGSSLIGRRVDEAGLGPSLERLLGAPLSSNEVRTEEVPLPDGTTLYASVSTILSANGERIGRVAVMRDITRFKELDELKSEFVATVSHDLRAPLTFMRGYATMLPMVGDLSDKQREYVEKILRGVGQMGELIDDLLDLGRIEAGVGLERKPCHLGTILVEAVDGMRVRAVTKGLTLRLEPPEGAPVVAGDAALLRQVVSNLVDNAIKYTPEGGTVSVGLSTHDDQAVIRVRDTGVGIAPEDQVRLFEKFYRIKRRETADVPGTGLGLAIVKSIVERHGGRVWVESELDKGSTFYVILPIGKPELLEPAGS